MAEIARSSADAGSGEDNLPCSIGTLEGEEGKCSRILILKSSLSEMDQKLIKLRTSCKSLKKNICSSHKSVLLDRYESRQKVCCLIKPGNKKCTNRTDLRPVEYSLYQQHRKFCQSEMVLVPGTALCVRCRVLVKKRIKDAMASVPMPELQEGPVDAGSPLVSEDEEEQKTGSQDFSQSTSSGPSEKQDSQENYSTPPEVARKRLNETLALFGKSPVDPKRLSRSSNYAEGKLSTLTTSISTTLSHAGAPALETKEETSQFHEMINDLKGKYNSVQSLSEKFRILSVVPKSWSAQKMMDEFGCSNFLARAVKKKVAEEGVFCSPNQKPPNRALPAETVLKVINAYEDDRFSRVMPGSQDFKTVREGNERIKKRKRLLMLTIGELHEVFKELYQMPISYSKFAQLRPLNVILPRASGSHNVCVCTIHQNVKLMLLAAHQADKLNEFPELGSYKDCIKFILCNDPTENCYMGKCSKCPKLLDFQEKLEVMFDSQVIDTVTFKQWTTVDRCEIETIVKDSELFTDMLCERLVDLAEHDKVATEQANFFASTKENLKEGEVLVVGDFAMNYSPEVQDAAQSYHWDKPQITIHPFVVYYKETEDSPTAHISFVIVSDYTDHDTASVYTFQRKLVAFLKSKFPNLKKIIYTSDGAGNQYKNFMNVTNLCHHLEDFGIEAVWHFTASYHGKGPCDAVSGNLKTQANDNNLRKRTQDDGIILTAKDLCVFIENKLPSLVPAFVSKEEVQHQKSFLAPRFSSAPKLHGIRKLHCILPASKNSVLVKTFSNSKDTKRVQFTPEKPTNFENLIGFVTVSHSKKWWLAKIISSEEETNEVNLKKLHNFGPRREYFYPATDDLITVKLSDILLFVSPSESDDGKCFKLSNREKRMSAESFMNVVTV